LPWVLALVPFTAARSEDLLRESFDDAWWTGPLLAASPATLPQGHILVEPYLYDGIVNEQFDGSGTRRAIARQNEYGSLTYLLYGLTDSLTIGLIPRFGYDDPGQGSSAGIGDITAQASFRLARYLDQGWLPAMSLVIGETFPTGRYDRLSSPSNGLGAGSYTTTLSLYAQYYLWMPNGRILRNRINLSEAWSSRADIEDASVYGTAQGFRGTAIPGDSFTIDSAFEYSVTRNWVAALDIVYTTSGPTQVAGQYAPAKDRSTMTIFANTLGSSDSISLAPAIEYNWTSTVGLIVGAKIVVNGRNTGAAVIPVAAINLVF
jgi:hypothetical protein